MIEEKKIALVGKFPSLREYFFKFREHVHARRIQWGKFKPAEIDFLNQSIIYNADWSVAEAHQLYEMMKRYHSEMKVWGHDLYRSVVKPALPVSSAPPARAAGEVVRHESISLCDACLLVYLHRQSPLHYAFKDGYKGRTYDQVAKQWRVPFEHSVALLAWARANGVKVGESAERFMIAYGSNLEQSTASVRVELEIPLKRRLFDYQTVGVDYSMRVMRSLVADQMGLGKAQPLTASVLTTKGYRQIGRLRVGDHLIDPMGGTTQLLNIFPQGQKPNYRVTFSDGTSTECCDEHLWQVQTFNQRFTGHGSRVLPLKRIMEDYLQANGNRKYFIPITQPAQFAQQDVDIHPYLLGALLGDGSLTGNGIRFSTVDEHLLTQVTSCVESIGLRVHHKAGCDYRIVGELGKPNALKQALRKYGACCRSEFKYIPQVYLLNDVDTRVAVLCGLMDTDGYVSASGTIQFSSSSQRLAEDVTFLVQSLGGVVRSSKKKTTHLDHYTLTLAMPDWLAVPFTLPRKMLRCAPRPKYPASRSIAKIEYIGQTEMACIRVASHSQLYLTNDCIVTHNTPQGIATAVGLNKWPILVICPKSLRGNWRNEIHAWSHHKAQIATPKVMANLGKLMKAGMCDFLIMNYESVEKYFVERIIPAGTDNNGNKHGEKIVMDPLVKIFKGAIVDEAHECRNPKVKRFRIMKALLDNFDYRQLLTGSPFVNTVHDLAALVTLLGHMEALGGEANFRKKYGGITADAFQRNNATGAGSQALRELNTKLRTLCMIRREKHQVLKELPDKFRTIVPIEIDNRADYDHAYLNLADFLAKSGGTTALPPRSQHAEALAQMMKLKQLSCQGKMAQAIDYIENILAQGEKVIVFVWHKATIDMLRKKWPRLLEISGRVDDDQVDANKALFQESAEHPLIVITYKRGGVGHTLTAAANVVFLELGWNPKDQDQAEDRAHRIGQLKGVTCHYLLGKDTVDEWIYDLIQQKRQVHVETTGSTEHIKTTSIESLLVEKIKNSKSKARALAEKY